ncbi:hypothetical protein BDZ94DRAFT_1277670 [Collybia nuda]|uniref:Uncharacterized protein n=1 Tax=Collybia nuda TaxID=64659 RepID=A0A9P5XSC1_9AGAR|nr:hypothetical protein BDZ94DRAFT_1277670 [Collybia nuda]
MTRSSVLINIACIFINAAQDLPADETTYGSDGKQPRLNMLHDRVMRASVEASLITFDRGCTELCCRQTAGS